MPALRTASVRRGKRGAGSTNSMRERGTIPRVEGQEKCHDIAGAYGMTAPDGRLSAREFLPWLEREGPNDEKLRGGAEKRAIRRAERTWSVKDRIHMGTARQKATGLQLRSRGEQL